MGNVKRGVFGVLCKSVVIMWNWVVDEIMVSFII